MNDEKWHVLPNGLRVNGISRPRIVDGVDTYTGERLAPEDPTPEEAEAQSVEHRRQRTANFFRQPKWTVDLVVSWIGYRDPAAIDVPFKPDIWKHSRPAIEAQPRLTLLRTLQSGNLLAIRHRQEFPGRVTLEEWLNVDDQWSVDLWPECVFARAEVIGTWPEVPAVVERDSAVPKVFRPAVDEQPVPPPRQPPLAGLQPGKPPLGLRPRGRTPRARDEVIQKMLPLLEQGQDLEAWSDDALKAEFKRAAGTCRSALQHALVIRNPR